MLSRNAVRCGRDFQAEAICEVLNAVLNENFRLLTLLYQFV